MTMLIQNITYLCYVNTKHSQIYDYVNTKHNKSMTMFVQNITNLLCFVQNIVIPLTMFCTKHSQTFVMFCTKHNII